MDFPILINLTKNNHSQQYPEAHLPGDPGHHQMDEGTITSNILWPQFSGPSLNTDSEKSSKESVVLTTCIPVHIHFHSTKLLAS